MTWEFQMEPTLDDRSLSEPMAIPRSALNPIALDIRYDALAQGAMSLLEWNRVMIALSPVFDTAPAPRVTGIEAALRIGSRRHAKRYSTPRLQSLALLLRSLVSRRQRDWALRSDDVVRGVVRAFRRPVEVSMRNLVWDQALAPPAVCGCAEVDPACGVVVSTEAAEAIRVETRTRPGLERGGLLMGHIVRDRGRLITWITRYVPICASTSTGIQLRLSPDALLAGLADVTQERGAHVCGWAHNHTPEYLHLELSEVDLATHHRVFRAPWNVACLALPSPAEDGCRLAWYGWRDASVRPIEAGYVRTPESGTEGSRDAVPRTDGGTHGDAEIR